MLSTDPSGLFNIYKAGQALLGVAADGRGVGISDNVMSDLATLILCETPGKEFFVAGATLGDIGLDIAGDNALAAAKVPSLGGKYGVPVLQGGGPIKPFSPATQKALDHGGAIQGADGAVAAWSPVFAGP